MTEGECPAGNLFAQARASGPAARDGLLDKLTDGRIAPEGAAWPDPRIVGVLRGGLDLDLGSAVPARKLFLQVDADQSVRVGVSLDGSRFAELTIPPHETASGLIARGAELPPGLVRYVRIRAADPTGVLAVTELGAYCDASYDMGRNLHVVAERASSEPATGAEASATPVDVAKVVVAALALAVVLIARRLFARDPRVPAAACAVLGAVAAAAYTNFGAYHHPRFVHEHDVFHYFVGAKYFDALGYDRLYTCAAAAEAEAGFPQRAALRPVRDLSTNRVVAGADLARVAPECHRAFGDARWRDFTRDVRVFSNASGVPAWNRVLLDHGFNASPVWIAPARAVTRPLHASWSWVVGWGHSLFGGLLPALDPMLLALSLGAIAWTFGPLEAGLAAIVFGCNPLSEFSWIGGGFLRQLWFASLVFGICLLHGRRWLLAGMALGIAAATQLFPAVCLAGLLAVAVAARQGSRLETAGARRALAAAAVTLALVMPLSAWASGRTDSWSAFAANTQKHASTPSANLVGLPAALSFRMDTRASVLFDARATDTHGRIRQARVDNYRRVRPLHWLVAGVGLWLFVRRVRRGGFEPWEAATFALALVPLSFELSSYYAEWLTVFAVVARRASAASAVVLATIVVMLFSKLLLASSDSDVLFAVESWIVTAGAAGVLWAAGRAPNDSLAA